MDTTLRFLVDQRGSRASRSSSFFEEPGIARAFSVVGPREPPTKGGREHSSHLHRVEYHGFTQAVKWAPPGFRLHRVGCVFLRGRGHVARYRCATSTNRGWHGRRFAFWGVFLVRFRVQVFHCLSSRNALGDAVFFVFVHKGKLAELELIPFGKREDTMENNETDLTNLEFIRDWTDRKDTPSQKSNK